MTIFCDLATTIFYLLKFKDHSCEQNTCISHVLPFSCRPHSTDSATHRKMTMSLADRSKKTQTVKVLPIAGKDPESSRAEMIKVGFFVSVVMYKYFCVYKYIMSMITL